MHNTSNNPPNTSNFNSIPDKKNMNSFYNTPSNFQLEQVDIELPSSLSENNTKIEPYMNSTQSNGLLQNETLPTESEINKNYNDEKPYGCLKNGFKPTYRTYMKTLKNRDNKYLSNLNESSKNTNNMNHITKFAHTTYKNKNSLLTNNKPKKRIKYVTKQIKTRRFKCGKNKATRKIGVVLKSGKTRSKVLAEKQNIKARPYAQMKNELYKKDY